ncbi:MAG: VIT domain-containing protein [Planctomycetota bacterium]|jgi:Ca-activated chloride channel family protein
MFAPHLQTEKLTDRISLRSLRLRGQVRGMSQRMTLEQVFVNGEDRDLEAIYTFPLPPEAAVCGFEVAVGDRTVTGAVEESERAAELYDDAISEGHGGYLLERERPDVFTVLVGNLKPGQAASVRVTWVAPVTVADREARLCFPTTIGPRFVSLAGMAGRDMLIENDVLNPPHLLDVPYGLSLELDVDLGPTVRRVDSPSHEIQVEPAEGGSMRVTLADGTTTTNRDVVVRLELEHELEPWAETARDDDGATVAAVTFVPELDEEDRGPSVPSRVLFVLDCSGSMQGPSIEDAKAALELCLRSLAEDDRFNIIRFGSTFEAMRPEPLRYTPGALQQALDWLAGVKADLGGTEIHPVLEQALTAASASDEPGTLQVILLTDGQVANEDAVIELARRHSGRHSMFTFGIGPAASAHLVHGLARVTGGASELIAPGEAIREKVLRMFNRMASPPCDDVRVDWGADVEAAPAQVPALFDGEGLTVYARYGQAPPAEVTLHATTPAGPRSWTVTLPPPRDDAGYLATIWARHAIGDLEDAAGAALGASRWRGRPAHGSKRLIELSKRAGVLCRLTTFVGIEQRQGDERATGVPVTRRVPIKLARGWHGVMGLTDGSAREFSLGRIDRASRRYESEAPPMDLMRADDGMQMVLGASFGGDVAPPTEKGQRGVVLRVLATQSAEGWFGDADLIGIAAKGTVPMPARMQEIIERQLGDAVAGLDPEAKERLIRTIRILLLLRVGAAEHRSLWRRADGKAARWLARGLGWRRDDLRRWLEGLTVEVGAAGRAAAQAAGQSP